MNIKKYYLYRFFNELMPIYPLYLLMFESRDLSVAQISLLLVIWSVPAIILEIPTGVLADRWSRKNLMFLGDVLRAACYLCWIFEDGFIWYAVGFVLWGIGSSFQSGSEEALLFDSLKIQGKEMQFDRILGKGRFLSGLSTITASIFGGFLGMQYGFELPLLLSVLSAIIGAVVALSMKDANLYKECLEKREPDKKENTILGAVIFLFKKKEIFLYTLLFLLVITTAGVLDEYDQLIAKEYGLSISLIGIWTAVRFILISCGGYLAYGIRTRIEKTFHLKDRMFTIALLSIIAAGLLVISGLLRHIGVMVLYGMYYLIMAAGDVLHEDYIQQRIEEEGRSTVHSLISLSQNLYAIFFYGIFGVFVSTSDLFHGLVWTGVYIAFSTIILGTLYQLWKCTQKRVINRI